MIVIEVIIPEVIDVVAFAVTPDPIGANSVSGYGFGGSCIEIKGADLYLDPPSFIVIELIVPFAPVVCPVITFAAANPIEEFVALLFCYVTGLAKVALVFPVMSVIKIVAALLTVLDAILTIP